MENATTTLLFRVCLRVLNTFFHHRAATQFGKLHSLEAIDGPLTARMTENTKPILISST